jgi:hypothetical protein
VRVNTTGLDEVGRFLRCSEPERLEAESERSVLEFQRIVAIGWRVVRSCARGAFKRWPDADR